MVHPLYQLLQVQVAEFSDTVAIPWPSDRDLPLEQRYLLELSRGGWVLRGDRGATVECLASTAWQDAWDSFAWPSEGRIRGAGVGLAMCLLSARIDEVAAAEWLKALQGGSVGWQDLLNSVPQLEDHPELVAWRVQRASETTASGKSRKPSRRGRPINSGGAGARVQLLVAALGIWQLSRMQDRNPPLTQVEAVKIAMRRWPKLAPPDPAALLGPEVVKSGFAKIRKKHSKAGKPPDSTSS